MAGFCVLCFCLLVFGVNFIHCMYRVVVLPNAFFINMYLCLPIKKRVQFEIWWRNTVRGI